jgi:hypothetical protein
MTVLSAGVDPPALLWRTYSDCADGVPGSSHASHASAARLLDVARRGHTHTLDCVALFAARR